MVTNVSFGNEQKQQKKSGGIFAPVAGAAIGGVATGVTKLGKMAPTLETLTKDEFAESVKDFQGEDKANADIVSKYLNKKELTEKTAAATTEDAAKKASKKGIFARFKAAREEAAEKEVAKLAEQASEALGKIQEKLPKKTSTGKVVLGATIGLGAGLIFKALTKNSKKKNN